MANPNPPDPRLLPSLQRSQGNMTLSHSSLSLQSLHTRDGEHLAKETGKHELAMHGYAHKTGFAITKAGELQVHAARTYVTTCEAIDAAAESAKGTPSQRYMETFTHYQKDQLALQVTDLYATGMNMIRGELARSLPDSAPPLGFWARLLGE